MKILKENSQSINRLKKYYEAAQNKIDGLIFALNDEAYNIDDEQLLEFSHDLDDATYDILRNIEAYLLTKEDK